MKSERGKLVIDIIISLIITTLVLGGLFSYRTYASLQKAEEKFYEPIEIEKDKYRTKDKEEDKESPFKSTLFNPNENRSFNFMLVGNDSRRGEFSRSDTLLVGTYNDKENKVLIFSIPRDTYVHIPQHGYDKINHAYAYGGPALSSVTIEEFLGLPIHKYASINFSGFIQLIDLIGGVPVNAKKDYIYNTSENTEFPINVKQGEQVLDGKSALGYARFRKDAEGDLGRIQRQQELIEALTKEMKKTENIAKLPEMVEILGNNLKTDVPVNMMSDYLLELMKRPDIEFEFDTLTGKGGKGSNGAFYFYVEDSEIQRFKDKMIEYQDSALIKESFTTEETEENEELVEESQS